MKQCPYCAQDLPDNARKCPSCTAPLAIETPIKWYFKTHVLIIAFLCVGPFALPLVWFNPHLSQKKKLIITAVILIFSYLLTVWIAGALRSIIEYYRLIFEQIS